MFGRATIRLGIGPHSSFEIFFIHNKSDQQKLQSLLNLIKRWSDEWLLRLNVDKCKSVSYCIKHPVSTDYHIMNRNQLFSFEKVQLMVDL